jgi:hypothetical protein
VRLPDASHATLNNLALLHRAGLVPDPCGIEGFPGGRSFKPHTPPERQAILGFKENTSITGSGVLSDFDPAELTFA